MADRVLVVDDELSLRKVLAATLQREGYEVTVCGDGEEGMAALERDGADVVVTDLVMPRMDGLTLLRKVVARHPDVPVIVVTAHGRIDSAVATSSLPVPLSPWMSTVEGASATLAMTCCSSCICLPRPTISV